MAGKNTNTWEDRMRSKTQESLRPGRQKTQCMSMELMKTARRCARENREIFRVYTFFVFFLSKKKADHPQTSRKLIFPS